MFALLLLVSSAIVRESGYLLAGSCTKSGKGRKRAAAQLAKANHRDSDDQVGALGEEKFRTIDQPPVDASAGPASGVAQVGVPPTLTQISVPEQSKGSGFVSQAGSQTSQVQSQMVSL